MEVNSQVQWGLVTGIGLIGGIYSIYLYRICVDILKAGDTSGVLRKVAKNRISKRDSLQLLIMTLLSVYAAAVFGFPTMAYFGYLMFSGMLCLLARIDMEERIVPDTILIRWLILIAVYIATVRDINFLLNRLTGALVVGAVMGGFYFLRRDSIGLGDIKLLMVCGLMKGFPGIISYLFRCLLLGLLFAVFMLVRKKGSMKTEIPFVPFLFLGALL